MPAERIAMRHVRDVLRLKAAGVSGNEIARRVGVAPSTVRLTLKRLAAAGLGWPLPAELTDTVLEAQLFTGAGKKRPSPPRRARLGSSSSRTEAQARHAANPVGRVPCGTSTSSKTPADIAIRGFVSCTRAGHRGSRLRCGKPMPAATSCSSITPATRCR
jgi:hypothetical protein